MRPSAVNRSGVYSKAKRAADFVLALTALIVLWPVFAAVALAIVVDSSGSVFFGQVRIGIHRQPFRMLKFRTMRVDSPGDVPTHLLADPDRHITGVGRFLRRTSLDELPQLLNVLVGSMSIVGPRPALWNQYDLVAERDRYGANDIRPGITGWAQVNGRDELPIVVKAKFDGEYVRAMSPLTDARCIILTVFRVLLGEGVVEGGTGTLDHASGIDAGLPEGASCEDRESAGR